MVCEYLQVQHLTMSAFQAGETCSDASCGWMSAYHDCNYSRDGASRFRVGAPLRNQTADWRRWARTCVPFYFWRSIVKSSLVYLPRSTGKPLNMNAYDRHCYVKLTPLPHLTLLVSISSGHVPWNIPQVLLHLEVSQFSSCCSYFGT